MRLILALSLAAISTAFALIFLSRLAEPLGLIDHPGGRKDHDHPVPLVGGLGMFAAFVGTTIVLGLGPSEGYLLLAVTVIMVIGLLDDLKDLRPIPKFVAQVVACLVMIYGAGVELRSVGDLVGFGSIGLSIFWMPLSVFAVVGVINAINMMDGMDGLAGLMSLVATIGFAAVAASSGLSDQFLVLVMLAGALLAFLVFNLRFPWQPRARVFLGDAGSMLLGFMLALFAIDLTQGPGRTFPPICALWIVLLPLADTVSLIVRRLSTGRSPFVADRQHIHHLLRVLGFSYGQTVLALVLVSGLFGLVGLLGWRLGVPEPVLFWTFFCLFFGYHFVVKAIWKRLTENGAPQTAFSTF
jgi:UDP-GlcNAc:undecaprenyl-phosphate/decaprenyl-phosphate GlcNAc-1-phosphate transferase